MEVSVGRPKTTFTGDSPAWDRESGRRQPKRVASRPGKKYPIKD